MTMRDTIEKQIIRIEKAMKEIGGDFRFLDFDEPSNQEEIICIESVIKRKLPEDFKKFALTVSRKISFDWMLPDNFKMPEELLYVKWGLLCCDIGVITELENRRKSYVKVVADGNEFDPEYYTPWRNNLPFHFIANGDLLSFDSMGRVIYLSHDYGKGHGYKLADSFTDLINRWLPLGCVGPEDTQWMNFVTGPESGILPDCEAANKFRRLMHFDS